MSDRTLNKCDLYLNPCCILGYYYIWLLHLQDALAAKNKTTSVICVIMTLAGNITDTDVDHQPPTNKAKKIIKQIVSHHQLNIISISL